MKPRFQADADFNHKIVVGLRRREPSIDFLGAHDGGVIGVPDTEVLTIAAESGRILISHDRKTMPGHFVQFRETRSSAGLIIVSQDLDIGAAIEDLLLIWVVTDAEEWVDHLGFVPFCADCAASAAGAKGEILDIQPVKGGPSPMLKRTGPVTDGGETKRQQQEHRGQRLGQDHQ